MFLSCFPLPCSLSFQYLNTKKRRSEESSSSSSLPVVFCSSRCHSSFLGAIFSSVFSRHCRFSTFLLCLLAFHWFLLLLLITTVRCVRRFLSSFSRSLPYSNAEAQSSAFILLSLASQCSSTSTTTSAVHKEINLTESHQ